MLILERKCGEKIFIGNNQEICVTLISVKKGSAKIGIDANKDTPIVREEVFSRNIEEQMLNALTTPMEIDWDEDEEE